MTRPTPLSFLVLLQLLPTVVMADNPPAPAKATVKITGRPAELLSIVEISRADGSKLDGDTIVEYDGGGRIVVKLALGENPQDLHVRLRPLEAAKGRSLRVAQRFETTFSLSDEGPHLDLLDWRHLLSEYEPVQLVAKHVYAPAATASSEFPAFEMRELQAAVSAQLAANDWQEAKTQSERWKKRAATCTKVPSLHCAVGVSRIELRIQARDTGSKSARWRDVLFVDLRTPLGC